MHLKIVRVNQCFWVERWQSWMAKPLTGHKIEMRKKETASKYSRAREAVKVSCPCYTRDPETDEVLFYAGMLDDFLAVARKEGYDVEVVDGRYPNPMNLQPRREAIPQNLRYGQADTLEAIFSHDKGIINAGVGYGKCLAKDTPVLCYDGTTKLCQDIVVGEQLMGPDSKPRTVVALEHGVEPLYKIIPVKGEPFMVTQSHQLTVVFSGKGKRRFLGREVQCGELFEITTADYLMLSTKHKRDMKLVRSSAVVFQPQTDAPKLDPYFLGVYLGDGLCCYARVDRNPMVTLSDQELVDYTVQYASSRGWPMRVVEDKSCTDIFFNKEGRKILQQETGCGTNPKAVKPRYLFGSIEERLQLLAGLIDTDGYAVAGCMYEIATKFDQLAKDILFLARSLGFAAYDHSERKVCTNTGAAGMYHRITISGDCSRIPLKVVRKRARPRSQKKDPLRTGFTVEPAVLGEYFGFQVTDDGRYLLGDFTITHNSYLMSNLCLIYPTARIVIVTAARELVKQIYESVAALIGKSEVGLVRGGTPSTEEAKRVVVTTCASILRAPLDRCDFLFFDQTQQTFVQVM